MDRRRPVMLLRLLWLARGAGGHWNGACGRGARNGVFRACFRAAVACRGCVVRVTFSYPRASSSEHYKGGVRLRMAPVKHRRKKYSVPPRWTGAVPLCFALCLAWLAREALGGGGSAALGTAPAGCETCEIFPNVHKHMYKSFWQDV